VMVPEVQSGNSSSEAFFPGSTAVAEHQTAATPEAAQDVALGAEPVALPEGATAPTPEVIRSAEPAGAVVPAATPEVPAAAPELSVAALAPPPADVCAALPATVPAAMVDIPPRAIAAGGLAAARPVTEPEALTATAPLVAPTAAIEHELAATPAATPEPAPVASPMMMPEVVLEAGPAPAPAAALEPAPVAGSAATPAATLASAPSVRSAAESSATTAAEAGATSEVTAQAARAASPERALQSAVLPAVHHGVMQASREKNKDGRGVSIVPTPAVPMQRVGAYQDPSREEGALRGADGELSRLLQRRFRHVEAGAALTPLRPGGAAACPEALRLVRVFREAGGGRRECRRFLLPELLGQLERLRGGGRAGGAPGAA